MNIKTFLIATSLIVFCNLNTVSTKTAPESLKRNNENQLLSQENANFNDFIEDLSILIELPSNEVKKDIKFLKETLLEIQAKDAEQSSLINTKLQAIEMSLRIIESEIARAKGVPTNINEIGNNGNVHVTVNVNGADTTTAVNKSRNNLFKSIVSGVKALGPLLISLYLAYKALYFMQNQNLAMVATLNQMRNLMAQLAFNNNTNTTSTEHDFNVDITSTDMGTLYPINSLIALLPYAAELTLPYVKDLSSLTAQTVVTFYNYFSALLFPVLVFKARKCLI